MEGLRPPVGMPRLWRLNRWRPSETPRRVRSGVTRKAETTLGHAVSASGVASTLIPGLQTATQRAREEVGQSEECSISAIWPENPDVELGIEERDFQAVARGRISMCFWSAVDQALEPESPKIVGHLGSDIRGLASESFDVGPEFAVAEASRQMWVKPHTAWRTAMTRGSPNRRAGTRCPEAIVGCWR
jgi:hypothetical protein